jgi:predicted CoA-binding protein
MKRTLVIGASENPERYSNRAVLQLLSHGHPVLALGNKSGKIGNVHIDTGKPVYQDLDTVTLYLGPAHQPEFYDYILNLKPRRVIFNPGTENDEFFERVQKSGIEAVEACTLVMLSIGNY